MKKRIIVTIVIISFLLVVLLLSLKNSTNINELTSYNFNESINNNNYSLVFYGDLSKTNETKLKNIKKDKKIEVYYSSISQDDYNSLFGIEEVPIFDLFIEGVRANSIIDEITDDELNTIIDKYFYGKMNEEILFKSLSVDKYTKKVKSNKFTVSVFGNSDCNYCTLYLPIINDTIKNSNVDIYYFNKDEYTDYDDLMELDLTIPGSCTIDGNPTSLKNGFPKPLTIITKNNKIVGCIKGYVSEKVLENKLKEVGVLK